MGFVFQAPAAAASFAERRAANNSAGSSAAACCHARSTRQYMSGVSCKVSCLGTLHQTARQGKSLRGGHLLVLSVVGSPSLAPATVSQASHVGSGDSANNIAPARLASSPEAANPVLTIHSPEEFKQCLQEHPSQLIILMCKARGCRPCKMFSRKYQRIADFYKDCVFLEIIGDESKETRSMMIEMNVRVTPTFFVYRGSEFVHTHGGINEANLRSAVSKHLLQDEAGWTPDAEAETVAAS